MAKIASTPTLLFFCLAPSLAMANAVDQPASKPNRNDPNFVRCVSQVETGSLVKKRRICRTNAEWDRFDGNAIDQTRDLQTRTLQGFNQNGGG